MSKRLCVPNLDPSAFVRAVAGIRPCRTGGLRLDSETLGSKKIIHNYGHGGCGVTLSLGCAAQIPSFVPESGDVGVLGAGVVALAAARELLLQGRRVTLYADRVAAATTSAIAGALWLPTGIDFPTDQTERARMNGILRDSFARFEDLVTQPRFAPAIETIPVYEPVGSPDEPELFESGAFAQPRQAQSPMPGSMKSGRVYETFFIHTPEFLERLLEQVLELGGRIEPVRFSNLADVLSLPEPTLVNCLALGARELFGDDAVYPARGVLVHLQPQRLGYAVHDGYRYLFPRKDALILGGTFEPGESSTHVPEHTVQQILEHHRAFFAEQSGLVDARLAGQ